MATPKYNTALIVGAGEGLSASLARLFAHEGIRVALAARRIEKLGALCTETGARAFACDATNADEVERLFGQVEREIAVPDLVVYNASGRATGRARRAGPADKPDSMLDPDAIALSYWNVLQQPRSAWTWELELRPWVEKF